LEALRCEEPGAPIGLACKTGTSNGFRDAWACGVMGDWVLCVWVGHFNGRGMPGLFAHETAAPLLWQTATRLDLPAVPSGDTRPQDVVQVPMCAVSGDLASKHCPNCHDGWFIGGVSPITTCTVHQKSGDAAVEIWSADRLEQFRKAGFPRAATSLPNEGELAERMESIGSPPRIVSPQSTLTYFIQANDPRQSHLQLEAHAAPGTRQIHWFADRRYLGASAPAEPLTWKPTTGDHELQAMDDAGRVSTTRVSVRLAMGR
jgi:penicillin-binding protein 1C